MKENVVFVMPDSLEDILWSSIVVINYMVDRHFLGRMTESLVVKSKHREADAYLESCWHGIKIVDSLDRDVRNNVDFIYEFDSTLCYQLTKAVNKHIVESFGIHLGTLPMVGLPPIAMIKKEQVGTVLVVARNEKDEKRDWVWDEEEKFLEIIEKKGINGGYLGAAVSWKDTQEMVSRASVVVGIRGMATLMAAAMGKVVIELTPDTHEHRYWAEKTGNKKSRMIYGKLPEMTAEFVWESLVSLMAEITKEKK